MEGSALNPVTFYFLMVLIVGIFGGLWWSVLSEYLINRPKKSVVKSGTRKIMDEETLCMLEKKLERRRNGKRREVYHGKLRRNVRS